MAHVVINAMSLRRGGGLQVMAGLVSRFDERNRYTVLWTDPQSREIFSGICGERQHVTYTNPLGNSNNAAIFAWGMVRQSRWLRANQADCVFGVNHHFPSGDIPQIVYHLNVLRFSRPRHRFWQGGEIADRMRDWRAMKALREAESNLFESHLLLNTARRKSPEIRGAEVVYIGLDDRRERQAPSLPKGDDRWSLLAVTSPAPHKDNATLVEMLADLVNRDPGKPWRLRIAGGNGRASFGDIDSLTREKGVADRVEFLGFLNHQSLEMETRRSLALVTTSLVESFCMVALEAMSWGCPAIVANISSMPESVGNAGLLAEPSDPRDFADKVLMLTVPEKRADLVHAGLARASEMTWSAAARQVEAAFGRAIARHDP